MKDRVASRRYAAAYLRLAHDTIDAEQACRELESVSGIINENSELGRLLASLEITPAEKSGVIERVFKTQLSEITVDFLKLLVKKGRTEDIRTVAEEARGIYYAQKGIEKAIIRSARPLDSQTVDEIKQKLEKKLNKTLLVQTELVPDLIGGVQAAVGNTVIDGSIKRKLAELREDLITLKL